MKPKTIAYLRVSTKEQAKDEATSFERQLQVIQAYVQAHNLKIDSVHEEPFTGAESRRPILSKLLPELPSDSLILIESMDRFTRSAFTGFPLLMDNIRLELDVIDCSQGESFRDVLTNGNADRRFLLGITMLVAQYWRDKAVENLARGRMIKSEKAGEYVGSYKNKYSPAFRKRLRTMREKGMTLQQIADKLNKEGKTTAAGYTWTTSHVNMALRPSKYEEPKTRRQNQKEDTP